MVAIQFYNLTDDIDFFIDIPMILLIMHYDIYPHRLFLLITDYQMETNN